MPLRRTADLALCVAIGSAVVVLIILCAWFFPDVKINVGWWMFGWFTAILWIVLIQAYWNLRRSTSLWLILVSALIVHTSVHAILFRHVRPWPGLVYLLTIPAEGMVVTYVVWKVLHVLPRAVTRGVGRHGNHENEI